jgi:hypothetical protein
MTDLLKGIIPGLMNIAKEAPMIGGAAGILLQFYETYEGVQKNREVFQELFECVKEASEWIINTQEILKATWLSEDKEEGIPLLKSSLEKLVKAVHIGEKIVASCYKRMKESKGVVDNL